MKKKQSSSVPVPGELNPSIFSGEGFLGTDSRSLRDIIDADRKELERSGIDKNHLIAALKGAFEKAQSNLGMETVLLPGVTATYHESRGKIPSPFREDGSFEKGEVVVTDTKSGETIIVTPLSINLIEKHDFFQGKGSRFRIDPGTATTTFGLRHP